MSDSSTNSAVGRHFGAVLGGLLTALAGALLLLIGDRRVTEAFASDRLVGTQGLDRDWVLVAISVALIVVGLAGTFMARRPLSRSVIGGITVLGTLFVAAVLLGMRVEDRFGTAARHHLAFGGWMLAGALLALVLAVLSYLSIGNPFNNGRHGAKAIGLGVASLVLAPLAPAAIIAGRSVSRGENGKRGRAGTAGIALGVLALTLWVGGLSLAAALGHP